MAATACSACLVRSSPGRSLGGEAFRCETRRCAPFAYTEAMTKPVTIRLDPPDYERLEDEARGLGMRPGTLARVLLHASLSAGARPGASSVDARLAALDRLMALAKGRPPADAVRLVNEAREDIGAESTS